MSARAWLVVLAGLAVPIGCGDDDDATVSPPGTVPNADAGPPHALDATSDSPVGTNADAGADPTLHDCAALPSRCGYPDATNTGPRAGTALRKVPGEITSGPGWAWEASFGRLRITGEGADVGGLDVAGPVIIDGANVVFHDSIVTYCDSDGDVVGIRAGSATDGYLGDGAKVLFNRLRCATPNARARSGVRDVYGAAADVTVQGNDIRGTGNGVTLEKSGAAIDNWIHDLGHLAGDHHSGLSNHGGATRIVYAHNTVLLAGTSTEGGGGVSGAITSYGDFARAQNVTIANNLVSGGSYTFYGGINNEDQYGSPVEIHIDQNRIVCGAWVNGPVFRRPGATNTFTGNFCDADGAPVDD